MMKGSLAGLDTGCCTAGTLPPSRSQAFSVLDARTFPRVSFHAAESRADYN